MSEKRAARNSEESVSDCLVRVLEEVSDSDLKIVTVIAMNASGSEARLFSNARSEAEMFGMLHGGLHWGATVTEEEDDDG